MVRLHTGNKDIYNTEIVSGKVHIKKIAKIGVRDQMKSPEHLKHDDTKPYQCSHCYKKIYE